MIILALDTTSNQASVAVRESGVTLAEEVVITSDGHSYLLYQMIQTALEKAGVTLAQIDCFASAVGPGSFTGVRICLAAAKGLADATGKPASGISNLRALASFGIAPIRSPILDARRGQIYTAIYNSDLALRSPEILTDSAQWITEPGIERITVVPPLASAIAACAELDGPLKWKDPAALDANYVRRSDAEMYWHDIGSVRS